MKISPLQKTVFLAAFCLIAGIGIGAGVNNNLTFFPFKGSSAEPRGKGLNEQGHAPSLPATLDFAGEKVPLNDREVRERLDRELIVNTYRHGSSLLLFKKAAQWIPLMESILESEGVPTDFVYLCMAESDFGYVVSPSGAAGFWQFMKPTAEQYGLVVNDEVDQRYDVEKSTHAACKYLKSAYQQFGSWTMAAASYNMGMAGLLKSSEHQNSKDYYDLLLNTETSRYVFRILALKLIHQNQESYGYYLEKDDLYEPYHYAKVQVGGTVNSWVEFAQQNGINYKQLRQHNMWIRDKALRNPEKRIYSVKIIKN